eukprot:GEMP01069447.1.p1 GENE.GEMP01069447.1~~GEMP01069447.1.p1  ORF type:complete len:267 (+),score=39.69 GEMP01069447.1:178-978(+)
MISRSTSDYCIGAFRENDSGPRRFTDAPRNDSLSRMSSKYRLFSNRSQSSLMTNTSYSPRAYCPAVAEDGRTTSGSRSQGRKNFFSGSFGRRTLCSLRMVCVPSEFSPQQKVRSTSGAVSPQVPVVRSELAKVRWSEEVPSPRERALNDTSESSGGECRSIDSRSPVCRAGNGRRKFVIKNERSSIMRIDSFVSGDRFGNRQQSHRPPQWNAPRRTVPSFKGTWRDELYVTSLVLSLWFALAVISALHSKNKNKRLHCSKPKKKDA